MRRLYKIIIFFFLIFIIGIYFTIKSINQTFSEDEKTEIVSMNPSFLILKNQPY